MTLHRRPLLKCSSGALALATALVLVGGAGTSAAAPPVETGAPELVTSPAHYMPAKHAKPVGSTTSANMSLHNGNVMTSTITQAIFWGAGAAAGDKQRGLDEWYSGWSGSNYAATTTEYWGVDNKFASATSSYQGNIVDSSTPPSGAPSTSQVLAEVAKVVAAPVVNGYYAVYGDTPRGSAGYCAWHSYGTIGGVPVQFAWFFNLDGDPGCDPGDPATGHSQGLEALANVSAHELAEAITDPRNGGWYDKRGYENGDKCAWTFGAPVVTLTNGTTWKLQGEWSNKAYSAGTGYPNSSGQRGCLSGA